jgi:hypothetical protein
METQEWQTRNVKHNISCYVGRAYGRFAWTKGWPHNMSCGLVQDVEKTRLICRIVWKRRLTVEVLQQAARKSLRKFATTQGEQAWPATETSQNVCIGTNSRKHLFRSLFSCKGGTIPSGKVVQI